MPGWPVGSKKEGCFIWGDGIMPCSDGSENTREGIDRDRINELTRYLCCAMRIIEEKVKGGDYLELEPGLMNWWICHKKFDRSQGRGV